MKDLEWFKEELRKLERYVLPEGTDLLVEYMQVKKLIDQIEQPETLSQKWIDDHKVARISNLRKMTTSDVVPVDQLEGLLMEEVEQPEVTYQQALNKIAERHPLKPSDITWMLDNHVASGGVKQPALPVIPEFVAEWLEKHKEQDLYWLLNTLYQHVTEIDDWFVDNVEKLIDAKRYGYTVDEKKYVVRFPNVKRAGEDVYLVNSKKHVEMDWSSLKYVRKHLPFYTFTEKEIKEIDPKYMAFAVPVEELEE